MKLRSTKDLLAAALILALTFCALAILPAANAFPFRGREKCSCGSFAIGGRTARAKQQSLAGNPERHSRDKRQSYFG